MKKAADIREQFLKFFEEKHNSTRIKSSSLVPDNPTILLTTAGMVQFVPYFLGLETPPFEPRRATTCQKCARAGGKDSDIENVGRTPRHHTFFEMLGNFSFGDYFKKEIIPWAWDFVTNYLELDKDRLWVTVYNDDDEAFEIWESVGVSKDRILRKGKKDNFWGPPGASGPCGPCSEIHYDLGEHLACSDDCSIETCECDRWVEIWNLVFMQLFQDEEGNQKPLEKKNVDTGMGLERIAMVCQGVESTFETDLLRPILDKVCELSGKEYKKDEKTDISLRIITDHARCVSFMIADGILPSNEGRGYVLRMILRRALRHGFLLGLELPFMQAIVEKVFEIYGSVYPELIENKQKILEKIKIEEEKFKQTLQKGWGHIESLIADLKKENKTQISGENAFKLYDTYGFPLELTKEIAEENAMTVDEIGFKDYMQEQKDRARAANQKMSVANDVVYIDFAKTDFTGYEKAEEDATVIGIVKGNNKVEESEADDEVNLILDKTPFYAESGGQIGDSGEIISENGEKHPVYNTFKVNKVYIHQTCGAFKVGDKVLAKINLQKRKECEKHHSLAHFLQSALIKVLGDEVHQAGSQVDNNRTRYDFTFHRAMTEDEVQQVEAIINKWISEDINLETQIISLEEAKKMGAIALFDEKYEDNVRMVTFKCGENVVSRELCGGCHTSTSKNIRLVKILSETAIAQGVRRIEAVASDSAFEYLNSRYKEIEKLSKKYKIRYTEVEDKISTLISQNHDLTTKIANLEANAVKEKFQSFLSKAKECEVNGVKGKVFISRLEDFPPNAIKEASLNILSRFGEGFILLVSVKEDGTSTIISNTSDGFVKVGVNSGKYVQTLAKALNGAGGGRPQFAQGAGKTLENLENLLEEIEKEFLG